MRLSIKSKLIGGLFILVGAMLTIVFLVVAMQFSTQSQEAFTAATRGELNQIDYAVSLFLDESKMNADMLARNPAAMKADAVATTHVATTQKRKARVDDGDVAGKELVDLFTAMQAAFGERLPLIAEDLGIITPEVDALREQFHLPGMRVLQFAFGGATEDRFLPHNYERNTVVYTGTHDNDTTLGWYRSISERERDFVRRYLGRDGHDIAWDLIRLAWSSVADYAITPLQDVLSLGGEARMNLPGTSSGNWTWRLVEGQLTPAVLDRLGELTELYAR